MKWARQSCKSNDTSSTCTFLLLTFQLFRDSKGHKWMEEVEGTPRECSKRRRDKKNEEKAEKKIDKGRNLKKSRK